MLIKDVALLLYILSLTLILKGLVVHVLSQIKRIE